ncbi:MAG: aspartate aminotransferase family protein [Thermodesulfobacteriota bacterium]
MSSDLIERSKKVLTPALVFHTDIVAKRAEGVYVEGADGKRYMDFSSGLATTSLGHCHPAVVKAIKEQAEKLIHSGCIFHFDTVIDLAEKLAEKTPDTIEKFFFSNSGAEAVEGAIKLARYITGRPGIVAFTGAFHGRTTGALSLTTSAAKYKRGYRPLLPAVLHSPYPHCYRCSVGQEQGNCSTECLDYLELMLRQQITPEEVACVIVEPVLGEGGYAVPPKEFMTRLRELCTTHGILLIADEVQTGIGRTGTWFASEQFGISPDIITIAKGIASGMPLSCVGASREIMDRWLPGAHGTTFGGNPLSCAAACATIDTIEKDNLLDNVKEVSAYALERLRAFKEGISSIGDVRGLGFMIGIEFIKEDGEPAPELVEKIMESCKDAGLVLVECGMDKNVVRLMPPLIATRENMEEALTIFEGAVSSL